MPNHQVFLHHVLHNVRSVHPPLGPEDGGTAVEVVGDVQGELWYNSYLGYDPAFDGSLINIVQGDNAYTQRIHASP